jgi:hypothetical protein
MSEGTRTRGVAYGFRPRLVTMSRSLLTVRDRCAMRTAWAIFN